MTAPPGAASLSVPPPIPPRPLLTRPPTAGGPKTRGPKELRRRRLSKWVGPPPQRLPVYMSFFFWIHAATWRPQDTGTQRLPAMYAGFAVDALSGAPSCDAETQ